MKSRAYNIFILLFFLIGNISLQITILPFNNDADDAYENLNRQLEEDFDLSSDTSIEDINNERATCPICYRNLEREPFVRIICGSPVPHFFHRRCIIDWFSSAANRNFCPIDRTEASLPDGLNFQLNHDPYVDGIIYGMGILPASVLIFCVLRFLNFGNLILPPNHESLSMLVEMPVSLILATCTTFVLYVANRLRYFRNLNLPYTARQLIQDSAVFSAGQGSSFIICLLLINFHARLTE